MGDESLHKGWRVGMTRVTAAIVTYRSKAELPDCLDSVLSSTVAVKAVVIDNASADGTLEIARSYAVKHDNVVAIDSGGNIGLAAANNLVIPHIEGDYVLILNPDAILTPDTLAVLTAVMDRNPEIGVIGPKNVYADGSPHTSYHRGWGFGHLILWRVFPYSFTRRLYDNWARYRESDVYYVSGACLLIRAEVFRQIGGYDPAYFLTAEDACDLCRRVRERGYRTRYTPRAVITHLTGRSGEQVPLLAAIESYKGSIYYFRKYYGGYGAYVAFGIVLMGCLTRVVTSWCKMLLRRNAVNVGNLRVHRAALAQLLAHGPRLADVRAQPGAQTSTLE